MDSRALRWKNQGMVFLITIVVYFVFCTSVGTETIDNIFEHPDILKNLTPILAVVAAFFGSAAIGFVINSITVTIVCIFKPTIPGKWYTKEWNHIKIQFWNFLVEAAPTIKLGKHNFKDILNDYPCDVILSYYWQQAPEAIVKWVSRRHDVFWTMICSNFAMLFGAVVFGILFDSLTIENKKILWNEFYIASGIIFIYYVFQLYSRTLCTY